MTKLTKTEQLIIEHFKFSTQITVYKTERRKLSAADKLMKSGLIEMSSVEDASGRELHLTDNLDVNAASKRYTFIVFRPTYRYNATYLVGSKICRV